jgi:toxin ParE1/3/4
MRALIISPEATQDLNNIADYFMLLNLEVGERLFERFNQRCKQLATFPNSGRSYTNLRQGLRGLSFESYIIFYRVTDESLTIVRVVSGRQDLSKVFGREK